jgi:probable blue pigment (indigoidine) exporter
MSHSSPRHWRDVLLTALAPAIWGSTYIVTSELLPPDRPFTAALIRVLPAGILLLLMTRVMPDYKHWWRLIVLSALNIGVFQALLFVAAYRLPGGLAGVVGMAVLLLSPQTVFEPVGIAAALLGAACMATGVWLTRRWKLNMPVLALTGWQLLLGGLMLLPVAWLVDTPLPRLTLVQVSAYAYLSLAGALLAYTLWFRGIARLPTVAVASLGLLSPLTAVVLGWALLSQAITGIAFLGLVVVLVSIFAVQWTTSRT